MDSESGSASHDDRGIDEEEEYEAGGGGNRLLGFMFGNLGYSGEVDADYFDEDAKEHLDALADKLGPSLADIALLGKSPHAPAAASATTEEDYDEKAEDAIDYEDIDEQYEGPEIEAATEEDHLLPKGEYFSADVSVATLGQKSSIFDDENYDEDEGYEKESETRDKNLEASDVSLSLVSKPLDEPETVDNDSECQAIMLPERGDEDSVVLNEDNFSNIVTLPGRVDAEIAADLTSFQKESAVCEDMLDAKNSSPLPILCIEDGMAILRFSEIFGIHEPPKRPEKREHRYSVYKDKYTSVAVSQIAEDDDEAFLRGSHQFFLRKPSKTAHDDTAVFFYNNSEFEDTTGMDEINLVSARVHDARKHVCMSAEPMRESSTIELSSEWHSEMSPRFYPLDQQDWETKIIWGNSPSVSENSMESCELSGPEGFESVVNQEMEMRPPDHQSDYKIRGNTKDFACHAGPISYSVEPFGSQNKISSPESQYHPRLLRLESWVDRDTLEVLDTRKEKEILPEEKQKLDFLKRFKQLTFQNHDLADGSWLDNVVWDPEKPIMRPKLIFDLQDEQMVFETFDDKDYEYLHSHAGAMITTQSGTHGFGLVELPGHISLSGGRFNIANDKFYSNRKASPQLKSLSKKRAAHGVKILHSIPGLKLQTVKTKLSNKDVANFHRPKALWYPHDNEVAAKQQERLPTQGPMKIILKSLGGKGSKIHVDAEETVSSIKVKASKKLDFRLSERVKIFYSGKDLEDNRTLSEQNVRPNSLLHLIRTKIHLLPVAQKLPSENKSLRPPGAFKKKSDLSVKDGHVFLMEYCEERPLLLGNPGMGARLCTYYQKSAPDDQNGETLRNTNTSLGTVLTLEPTDKSPFLGDIKPGFFQSSLETNMYRAPIFPHKVSSTDYLLVRSAKGKLSIRRIERIHVVGQQEPHMEVMSPAAKGLQTYMVNRLLVYMYREFRAAEKRGTLPCIRADEISVQFPNISEPFLRKRLKHCVDLQRGSNGQLSWVMRANFHIPPEEELRRIVTPESVCAYESMQAGLYRLKRLGIIRLAHLTGPNQLAALSSAMNQLPDEAIALAAASHIERELQITPWNLSSNFVACTGQNRENIERLEIAGVGDPSGRGLGFSYVRVAPKGLVSNAMVKKKPAVVKGTTVTGTDADLRRLSMDAAREVLLKFNIPEEQIAKLTRWHRIAMIRKLSSEQTASGVEVDPTTISKYARGQRMSFLQLQQQTREKCREIWDRQVQSLSAIDGDENECDSEPNSDLDSFAGDLENLLDAEECEGEESNLELENEKSDGVRGLKMRKHPSEAPPEEVIEDEAAEAAELCKLLMDDDEAQCKKKKARPMADEPGFAPIPQANLGFENTERAKKSSTMGSHIVGPLTSTGPFFTKQKADLTEVGNFLPKMTIPGKVKPSKKNEPLPASLLNKKVKIMTDGVKVFKEKKSARESFVCGACGQLGHMRTNKNCPKYGEDPEMQVNNTAPEKSSAKTTSLDPLIQADLRPPPKKLIPKTTTTTNALPEPPDGETSSSKAKVLKVICASVDKTPDKVTPFPTRSSEQLSTSETDTGDRQFPKVSKIKITNKVKGDENQAESHKPNIVIRPPTELVKESAPKKIIIKQPKETNNLYQSSLESPGIEFKKTKMMNELTGSETSKKQQESIRVFEEEKMTNMEILGEERSRRTWEEEIRMPEEQERVAALRIYEEAIRREREEEERQKAQKKKKKKKSVEVNDDYMEDYWARRNSRWNPERERSAKRKSVELGRYSGDYGQPIKRRKGGEVGLANILEGIIETLKGRYDVSYLFLKPVSKKEAPDYLDIVKHPMDLSTIREKIRRLEYKNRDEFRQDVWQITYNAHLYNDGRNPGIPPLADQLLEICDYLLDENDESLTEAEAGIDDRD